MTWEERNSRYRALRKVVDWLVERAVSHKVAMHPEEGSAEITLITEMRTIHVTVQAGESA